MKKDMKFELFELFFIASKIDLLAKPTLSFIQKMEATQQCASAYTPVKQCIVRMKTGAEELLTLASAGDVEKARTRAEELKADLKVRCELATDKYYNCCANEEDCSLIESDSAIYLHKLQETDSEILLITGFF